MMMKTTQLLVLHSSATFCWQQPFAPCFATAQLLQQPFAQQLAGSFLQHLQKWQPFLRYFDTAEGLRNVCPAQRQAGLAPKRCLSSALWLSDSTPRPIQLPLRAAKRQEGGRPGLQAVKNREEWGFIPFPPVINRDGITLSQDQFHHRGWGEKCLGLLCQPLSLLSVCSGHGAAVLYRTLIPLICNRITSISSNKTGFQKQLEKHHLMNTDQM